LTKGGKAREGIWGKGEKGEFVCVDEPVKGSLLPKRQAVVTQWGKTSAPGGGGGKKKDVMVAKRKRKPWPGNGGGRKDQRGSRVFRGGTRGVGPWVTFQLQREGPKGM